MTASHARTGAATSALERDLVITRVFDAPRDLVFKAWTEPERLVRWWGPNGFTTPVCTIDLRPGGVFHNCMRSPEGRDYWSRGATVKSSSRSGSSAQIPFRMKKAISSSRRTTE